MLSLFQRLKFRLPGKKPPKLDPAHVESLWVDIENRRREEQRDKGNKPGEKTAILMTTYNRPHALERSLPRALALNCLVVVVDDGSDPSMGVEYEKIRLRHASDKLHWISLPSNRGIMAAVNAGLAYLLADPTIDWISYLQDDVEVHPELLTRLGKIQDREKRPLCSGRRSLDFPLLGMERINESDVIVQWASSGQHFHAHRSYWEGIFPMPTRFLGAPRKGRASDFAFWVSSSAPRSAGHKLLPVYCLSGLARQFLHRKEDSTWNFEALEDPPLLP